MKSCTSSLAIVRTWLILLLWLFIYKIWAEKVSVLQSNKDCVTNQVLFLPFYCLMTSHVSEEYSDELRDIVSVSHWTTVIGGLFTKNAV